MNLVITRDHSTAINQVRRHARRYFGNELGYTGHSLPELLSSIPILSKKELTEYGARHAESFLSEAVLFSETSGTTSAPLQTPRNKQDLGWNVINQMNAYKELVQPGVDRLAILHPSVLSPFVEGSALALHNLGVGYVRIYPIPGVCDYERIFEVLERYRITSMMSTPSLLYKILYELKRVGEGRLPIALKRLFATGERFGLESIRNMERILGAGSFVTPFVYGSSETATIMVGRPDGSYRPIAEDFVFEIDDPRHEVGGTARGKLLVTWLRDGMLPILRYDTGDIFTVTRTGHGDEFAFHFNGRVGMDGIGIEQQNALEAVIYSLPVSVFHFECMTDTTNKILKLVLITDSDMAESNWQSDARAAIVEVIGEDWRIKISVNPEGHSFFDFSPSPKTKRFHNA